MVGNDVPGRLEPEDRHLGQHLPLVGDRASASPRHRSRSGPRRPSAGPHPTHRSPGPSRRNEASDRRPRHQGDANHRAKRSAGAARLRSSARVTLPPEPEPELRSSRPSRWAFRPLPFMQDCREKLGDSFSVKFLGFERPMVMISDPEAIKALYTERANGLPPGRNIVLEPIMGSRSVLLLEGDDHLARRKLMLPPFHGERMRSYQPVVEEIVAAEIDSWPIGEEFPIHSRMQAVTLEVILRVVFGVADGPRLERLRGMLGKVLVETASPGGAAGRPRHAALRRPRALGQVRGPAEGGRRAALRGDRRAPRRSRPRGARRHPLDADAGALRGRRGDERLRAARPADDPAAGRPRDDGDGAGLDLRPAAPPPARRCSGCATRWRRARTITCARRSPSRCACAR